MEENNKSNCPKAPDEEILRMLIRAHQFLNHAKEHSLSGNEFDVMISIHNLDNALEYILRILIKHFDVESVTGKTIDSCEISILIGELKRFFNDYSLPALPFEQDIKLIRQQRNLVQHAITNPASDIKMYVEKGDKFFSRVLEKYFGITEADLNFSVLVEDEQVRVHVKNAEKCISNGNYLEAIVNSRDAFDYAFFNSTLFRSEKTWNPPATVEAREEFKELPYFLSNMNDLLSMSVMNVDMPKYNQYREYLHYIPSEHRRDIGSHTVKQKPWKKEDAEFCYLFVCETILHWQNFDMSQVDEPEVSVHEYQFEERFENIRIDEYYPEKGCKYGLSNGYGHLFYLDSKEKVDTIISKAKAGCIRYYFKNSVNGKVINEYTEYIKVLGFEHKLVVNNPEIWEVYIFYNSIPFTKIRQDGKKSADLMDDSMDIPASLKACLPIDDTDKAFEVYNKMLEDEIDVEGYYCQSLLDLLDETMKAQGKRG